jgi:sugar lactone lactonase YvrE
MRRIILSVLSVVLAVGVLGPLSGSAPARAADVFPARIALPDGWRPEGMAIGEGAHAFVGSLANGAILRADLVTGRSSVFVPGTAGTSALGLEIDQRDRIWTATGGGGGAVVYSAETGARLASFQFAAAGTPTFVNDAIATPGAVYFTDSMQPVLYVVPLGRGGRLPDQSAVRTLRLSGGAADPTTDTTGFNNGIETTPDGRLIVGQTRSGKLFEVDPRTGASRQIDLGGASVPNADGIIRRGHTLYVDQNRNNQVAVVQFDAGFVSARVARTITDPGLDVPSAVALFGPFLYAVNARFTTPPTPTTTYDVVRLRA